jgi:hypothetical protein
MVVVVVEVLGRAFLGRLISVRISRVRATPINIDTDPDPYARTREILT